MNLNLIILINILIVIGLFCLLSVESSTNAVPMLSLQSNDLNNHWNLFKSKHNRTHHNRTHEASK